MRGKHGIVCECEKKTNFGTDWSMRYKMVGKVKPKCNIYPY